ncbi:MAG: GntR family transcriptional regulator [Lachnospiraceae bacterium]
MKHTTSLKDAAYSAILNDILSYEYRPNEILNEKTLVEKYGYSKTPIREALQSLCNDSVLRNIPRYGYEVVRITTDDVHDMLQYRYILESGLLSSNYIKFTERQINRLREIDQQCTDCGNDIWAHWAFNVKFHLKMIAYCNNNYALGELEQCMNRLKIAYAQFYWNNIEKSVLEMDTRNHTLIIESLLKKDLEQLLIHLKNDLHDFGGDNFSFEIRLWQNRSTNLSKLNQTI